MTGFFQMLRKLGRRKRFGISVAGALLAGLLAGIGCADRSGEYVVVYTSQDQVYAEPIFREFTRQTGIAVRPVFDSESVKTAGLANRLRFERANPQCDLFWSNEELHARLLEQENLLSSNHWLTIGYRTRRVVINTNKLALAHAPKSLLELTNDIWRGKFAMAYPVFGTTASHLHALRQAWGEGVWKQWCEGVARNGAMIVDGNSVVVKLVGSGEATIGLTDSDDIAAGQRQNLPILALPLGPDSLAIANTVAVASYARRSENAMVLLAYLAKPETLQTLVEAQALESAYLAQIPVGVLKMDWRIVREEIERDTDFMKSAFRRL